MADALTICMRVNTDFKLLVCKCFGLEPERGAKHLVYGRKIITLLKCVSKVSDSNELYKIRMTSPKNYFCAFESPYDGWRWTSQMST